MNDRMAGEPAPNDAEAAALVVDARVDAVGLDCPMPLLKAKRALNAMAPGERLEIRATDPGSVRDFEVFCEQSGHGLIRSCREGDVFVHVLRKA